MFLLRWSFLAQYSELFTSRQAYRRAWQKSLGQSLRFLFLFFLCFAFFATTWIWLRYLRPLERQIQQLPPRLLQLYPEKLELHWKNGSLQSNLSEPVLISWDEVKKAFPQLNLPSFPFRYLLVIDTQARVDDFPSYQTPFLLTKRYFIYWQEEEKFSALPWDSIFSDQEFTLTRGEVNSFLQILPQVTRPVLIIVLVAIFIGFSLGYFLTSLLVALFGALLLFLASLLILPRFTYGQIYKLTLHLLVVYLTLIGLLNLAQSNWGEVTFSAFSLPGLIIFLLYGIIILYLLREEETALDEEIPLPPLPSDHDSPTTSTPSSPAAKPEKSNNKIYPSLPNKQQKQGESNSPASSDEVSQKEN